MASLCAPSRLTQLLSFASPSPLQAVSSAFSAPSASSGTKEHIKFKFRLPTGQSTKKELPLSGQQSEREKLHSSIKALREMELPSSIKALREMELPLKCEQRPKPQPAVAQVPCKQKGYSIPAQNGAPPPLLKRKRNVCPLEMLFAAVGLLVGLVALLAAGWVLAAVGLACWWYAVSYLRQFVVPATVMPDRPSTNSDPKPHHLQRSPVRVPNQTTSHGAISPPMKRPETELPHNAHKKGHCSIFLLHKLKKASHSFLKPLF